TGRQKHLRSETLKESSPTLVARKRGSKRTDALRRHDRDESRLARHRKRSFVAGWLGFANRRKGVVLVGDKQNVAPGHFGVGCDFRDALQDRPLKIQFEKHAESPRQAWIHRHGEVQPEHVAGFEQFVKRRKRSRLTLRRRLRVDLPRRAKGTVDVGVL